MTESFSISRDEARDESLTVVVCRDCSDGHMVKLMPVDPEWEKLHARWIADVSAMVRKFTEVPAALREPRKHSYLDEIRLRARIRRDAADLYARAADQLFLKQEQEMFRKREV